MKRKIYDFIIKKTDLKFRSCKLIGFNYLYLHNLELNNVCTSN